MVGKPRQDIVSATRSGRASEELPSTMLDRCSQGRWTMSVSQASRHESTWQMLELLMQLQIEQCIAGTTFPLQVV